MELRIAARRSDLARLQAYQVGERLLSFGHNVDYHFRQSLGDQNQNDPLWKMPEKGVFTEDFRQGLIDGQFDMVVHSWKDLPVDIPESCEIVATLPRADQRDLFLFKKSHYKKVSQQKKIVIFSSSPRRIYNAGKFLKNHLPFDLDRVVFQDVRGNILTRIEKLMSNSEVDGLIVAKAAIDRLRKASQDEFGDGQKKIQQHLKNCRWQVLPLTSNPTAAAQGALAIEVKSSNSEVKEIVSQINCQKTWNNVIKERQVLKSYGGGCHQKIGVSQWSRDFGEMRSLKGLADSGEVLDDFWFSKDDLRLTKPFPLKQTFFKRESIPYQKPSGYQAHFIARSEALPDGESFTEDEVVWVSGEKSWRKLAKRGYWVNGCSESLGETDALNIDCLVDEKTRWLKWTHNQSESSTGKQTVATYQLLFQPLQVNLADHAEFFWMSGTQFQRALEIEPKIIKARHFCGAGHTYTKICQILAKKGISQQPTILPSSEIWQRAQKG